jgi:protocatechuate 3,4-dioxygenase beta subunit
VKPGTTDLALVLEPPIGVAGRVVDDLGAPVAKFQVHARTKTSGMLAGLGAETASDDFEDPEGRFLLDSLRAGEWEAFAAAEGHTAPEPVAFQMPREEGSELLLVLERAASVAGTVIAPDGSPVAGARVGKKRGLADLSRLAIEGGKSPSATTDADGRFALQGLAPTSQELVAEHADFAPSAAFAVDLSPAEARADVVLALRTGGRILGVIYDDEGDPWPGQTILCQDPTLERGQLWATSDGSGAFEFDHLAPGAYQVMTLPRAGDVPVGDDEADPSDFASIFADMKFTMAEVREGEDTHVALGAKPANPVRVQGRVTAAGAGVQGAMVSFIADGGGGFESMRFTNTESEGRFELELTKPGRYLVTVQKMIGTGQQQSYELLNEVPEAEEHEVEIELPLGGISGQVRGPDGSPIQNARVSLNSDGPVSNGSFTGGNYAEIWTDDEGRYELVWLKPGSYTVAAGGSFLGGIFGDGGEETFGRSVRRGIEVDEGEQVRGVDFRLERPGSISGRVSDASGAPVADAAIFLRDEEGNPLDRISMITTDSGGRFEYGGLEPGSYHVQARTAALVSGSSATVRVREGEESEAALVLEGGTVLVVSLSDADGNSVRCRVTVTDDDGNQVNGLWSLNDLMSALSGGSFSSDEQRVGPLPPGKYTIEAIADDGRDAQKTITLSGQDERPMRLRLD